MIRFKKYFLQITGIKKKLIIGCSIAAIVLVSGMGVYAINTTGKEDTSSEKTVEDNAATEENSNQDADSVQKASIEETQPNQQEKVYENKPSDTENIQNKSEQSKPREQVKQKSNESVNKKEHVQQKQASNNSITYTSKGLGISFDMPASWANKYDIQDSGTEVMVISKCIDNNIGSGFLFLITSDLNAYAEGSQLNPILGDIHKNINNKKYLIGGPTDTKFWEKDPNFNAYKIMQKECVNVLKSLRAA
jgi:hypothetical protein